MTNRDLINKLIDTGNLKDWLDKESDSSESELMILKKAYDLACAHCEQYTWGDVDMHKFFISEAENLLNGQAN